MGLACELEPHGRIWLKDLNQGFGAVEQAWGGLCEA
jgi:hypothetical protein